MAAPQRQGYWTEADLDALRLKRTASSITVAWGGQAVVVPWGDGVSLPAWMTQDKPGPLLLGHDTLRLPQAQVVDAQSRGTPLDAEKITLMRGPLAPVQISMQQVLDHWLDEPLVDHHQVSILGYERPRQNLAVNLWDVHPSEVGAVALLMWSLRDNSFELSDRGYYIVRIQTEPSLAVLPLRYLGTKLSDPHFSAPRLLRLHGRLLLRFGRRLEAVQPDGTTGRLLALRGTKKAN